MTSSGISVFVMILLRPLTDKVGRKPLLIWNVTMMLIGVTIRTAVVFNSLNVYLVLIVPLSLVFLVLTTHMTLHHQASWRTQPLRTNKDHLL